VVLLPKTAAGPAKCFPEDFRILFGPGGVIRKIRGERNNFLGQKFTVQIKDQRFQALGPVVNGQQEVFIHDIKCLKCLV
jgi:hypothetical protein